MGDVQVSIGWAASPMRTSRSLCHLGIGPLATSFQNLTSLALLSRATVHVFSVVLSHMDELSRARTHLNTGCSMGEKCVLAYSKGVFGSTVPRKSRYLSTSVNSGPKTTH